jgi:Flp pilus assembly pilin Flp
MYNQTKKIGAGLTEYIIIIALVAIAAIGVIGLFGSDVKNSFMRSGKGLQGEGQAAVIQDYASAAVPRDFSDFPENVGAPGAPSVGIGMGIVPAGGFSGITITGGTAAQQAAINQALADIYSTPRGAQMQAAIEGGTPLTININSTGGLSATGSVIQIDPSSHPVIQTTAGPLPATTLRILAHEIGHAAMGERDDGANNLNNVIANENPVMSALGEPERTAY